MGCGSCLLSALHQYVFFTNTFSKFVRVLALRLQVVCVDRSVTCEYQVAQYVIKIHVTGDDVHYV